MRATFCSGWFGVITVLKVGTGPAVEQTPHWCASRYPLYSICIEGPHLMMFNTRIAYTRKQIGQVVGGSLKVPFPSKDGRVVAICLSRDTNPDAPQRILVADRREPPGEDGRIDRREAGHAANMLVTQGGAVPLSYGRLRMSGVTRASSSSRVLRGIPWRARTRQKLRSATRRLG